MIVSRPTLPPRPSASDGRGPGPKTLDIGLSASRSLPTARTKTARAEIRSLHSATKTRFVQDQFPRNPESDVADLTHRNEAGSCDSLAVAVTGLRSQGASAHSARAANHHSDASSLLEFASDMSGSSSMHGE